MNETNTGLGNDCCRPIASGPALLELIRSVRAPLAVYKDKHGSLSVYPATKDVTVTNDYSSVATLPPLYPEWLGDRGFCAVHGVRFAYIAGAMARGIASIDMVVAMGKAGMMGFLGSAGLSVEQIQQSICAIQASLNNGEAWGCNLIHTPDAPDLEMSIVQLFLQLGVSRISASAFMSMTPALAAYAYKGIYRDSDGAIRRANYVFAKISRPETAAAFMKPAPQAMLKQLLERGLLTEAEVQLAQNLPVSEDITVEADSGGHTDGQILTALFPTILDLKHQLSEQYQYQRDIRIGAAGGLGTPSAIAAAFALGAAYVLTGSVNQACIEAGTSQAVKQLLTQVRTGDVAMAPCADMFEAGVKVQVLKRRTLYAPRSTKLYEIYKRYDSLEDIPAAELEQLEKAIFRQSLTSVWQTTKRFFETRDPAQLAKAEANPKVKMGLIFRWYLGSSSRWPIDGDEDRLVDYQIWCGPAQAAFNDWVRGSFLEPAENRAVVQVARNLLEGAAIVTRAQQLRTFGIAVPQSAFAVVPQKL
ncbi:PfaD family polyunsaturated fatty acid/polyketide biosynthesis protein [Saccharophagus degradans]|uniref:PfaD family polyunsaturated fatty acid/polyketide biosynthesis protein n=1 Tax=Saccharophagus degradans TaxID=86304 RepID=UPI001C0896B6|nr:PfaD family polyunsaturated fatty acid/polyketide biosynthesis protein [Saccharophagus degradans]